MLLLVDGDNPVTIDAWPQPARWVPQTVRLYLGDREVRTRSEHDDLRWEVTGADRFGTYRAVATDGERAVASTFLMIRPAPQTVVLPDTASAQRVAAPASSLVPSASGPGLQPRRFPRDGGIAPPARGNGSQPPTIHDLRDTPTVELTGGGHGADAPEGEPVTETGQSPVIFAPPAHTGRPTPPTMPSPPASSGTTDTPAPSAPSAPSAHTRTEPSESASSSTAPGPQRGPHHDRPTPGPGAPTAATSGVIAATATTPVTDPDADADATTPTPAGIPAGATAGGGESTATSPTLEPSQAPPSQAQPANSGSLAVAAPTAPGASARTPQPAGAPEARRRPPEPTAPDPARAAPTMTPATDPGPTPAEITQQPLRADLAEPVRSSLPSGTAATRLPAHARPEDLRAMIEVPRGEYDGRFALVVALLFAVLAGVVLAVTLGRFVGSAAWFTTSAATADAADAAAITGSLATAQTGNVAERIGLATSTLLVALGAVLFLAGTAMAALEVRARQRRGSPAATLAQGPSGSLRVLPTILDRASEIKATLAALTAGGVIVLLGWVGQIYWGALF